MGTVITDEEILAREFSISDPESVDNLTEELPPDGAEVTIEFEYNVRSRGRQVRCVYCERPNHFRGVVALFGDGKRRLVGKDCAKSKHGHIFKFALDAFNDLVDRKSYLIRASNVRRLATELNTELDNLLSHPSVEQFDAQRRRWMRLGSLARDIAAIAREGGSLTTKFRVRDHEREKRRRETLGENYEFRRAEAKRNKEEWTLWRTSYNDRGVLAAKDFFGYPGTAREAIDKPIRAIKAGLEIIMSPDADTRTLTRVMVDIQRQRSALESAIDFVSLLPVALSPSSLAAIEAFSQDLDRARESERAEAEDRNPARLMPSFELVDGELRRRGEGRGTGISMPPNFRAPSKRAIELLSEAVAADA